MKTKTQAPAKGSTKVTTRPQTHGTWVLIEREHDADLWVGPYSSAAAAEVAMNDSALIAGLCEEDCLECYVHTCSDDTDDPLTRPCDECGASPAEPCRPDCTAEAASADLAWSGHPYACLV